MHLYFGSSFYLRSYIESRMNVESIMLSEISQRKTNTIRFHLYVESKEQSVQTKQKQTHRYREQRDGCHRGGWFGGLGEKGEGIEKYRLVVTKYSWGCTVQYSIGNTSIIL